MDGLFNDHIEDEIHRNPSLSVEMLLPPKLARNGYRNIMEDDLEGTKKIMLERILKVPASRYAGDEWVMNPLASAPNCEVCGWCPADIEVSSISLNLRGLS